MDLPHERLDRISHIGEKIKYLRRTHKPRRMTQQQLARLLKWGHRGYISEIEHGKKTPTTVAVLNIARIFEVTTDYLLRDEIPVGDVEQHRIEEP